MGNITGNTSGTGGGGFGNNDFVNFQLGKGGVTTYQYKITGINTVDLTSGTLILDDRDVVGTVTLGPGNIDPVNTFNHSSGATLGVVVDANPHTPATLPIASTITVTSGYGTVTANTVNIGTGAVFKAYEEADFYANKNIYPNVVVGLTSLTGNYAQSLVLSNSPLFDASMIENGGFGAPGSDTLVLGRRHFNNPAGGGLTPNENAAGLGLEGLYATGTPTAMTIIGPLFGLNGPQYAAALKSLDGETILERPDLWQTVLDSILHRLSQGDGFTGAGVAGAMLNHGPIQVASAGQGESDPLMAQAVSPMMAEHPWSVWLRGYGVFADGPATINAAKFHENREGAIGGIDYHVTDQFLVGGVFNYGHGEVTLDQPTPAKNKQDAYQFAAYGKYQQGPWYVNGILGGGFTSNNETRQVLIPMPASVSGHYSGETISAYLEAGWDLRPGNTNLKLTPLAGVGYNYLRYDGFTETGSPSALKVNAATTDNLYTALGARAQMAFNIGTNAPLVPEVRVVWQHEFLNANQEMNAAFVAGGGLFNVQGSKFSRESVIAGIGVSNNVSPDLKVFLDYDAKIQGGYFANAVSAGLRWSFGGAPPPPPPAAPPPLPAAQPAPPPPSQAQVFVVYFDFDKSVLTPEAVGIIRQAADTFKRTGAVTIKIDGYTDLAGTQQYNIGLSHRRADTVRAELAKDGVPAGSVAESWHGKSDPAVPTPDGVREPRNRRVTLALP
jgi:outer membrane autotransporter protein